MKKLLCLSLCAALAVSSAGCASSPAGNTASPASAAAKQVPSEKTDEASGYPAGSAGLNIEEMFTDRDTQTDYDEADATALTLNSTEIQCGSGSVDIDGATATIRGEGTYILTGRLENGQIIVDADKNDKVRLVLDGASINCDTGAAVYVRQADKVFITLAAGSENTLSNTGESAAAEDNSIDAVLFSKEDLTLNGSGSLTINAAWGHGAVSKDDLVITGGTYTIQSAGHGLSGKDSVRILDGVFVINSGKDGVHAENKDDASLGFIYIAGGTYSITAQGDGFDAATILQADDGSFTVTAGGGSQNAEKRAERGGPDGGWGGGDRRQRQDGGTPAPAEGTGGERQGSGSSGQPQNGTAPSQDQIGGRSGQRQGQGSRPDRGQKGSLPDSKDTAGSGDTPAADAVPEGLPDRGESAGSAADGDAVSDTPSAKGFKAGTLLLVRGGTFSVNSADDSLHSNGSLTVQNGSLTLACGDDAIHADGALTVSGGTIDITASYEGLEGRTVEISGGVISLTASDDGLNPADGSGGDGLSGAPSPDSLMESEDCFIRITGGIIRIDASGDGMDSNGSLYITGGEIYVDGPDGGGNGALDYDKEAVIEGGFVVATDAGGMSQNFSQALNQGSVMVQLSQTQNAGTTITLTDAGGRELISRTPQKSYSSIVISCPGIAQGQTYELTAGAETVSVTMDSLIYGAGGMGMRGGGPR